MAVDRREFVKFGAMAAASAIGASCVHRMHRAAAAGASALTLEIRGLCIVERRAGLVNVHLVDAQKFDANKFMVVEHLPLLSVAASDVNAATTATSVPDPYMSGRKVFTLKDHETSVVGAAGDAGSLGFDDGLIGEGIPGSC